MQMIHWDASLHSLAISSVTNVCHAVGIENFGTVTRVTRQNLKFFDTQHGKHSSLPYAVRVCTVF